MSLLVLILAVFVLLAPTVILLLMARRRDRPIQFSLRALFAALTAVALIFGAVGWWRAANLAQTEWLDPDSSEAVELFPRAEAVKTDDGEWSAAYHSRCRAIHDLAGILESNGTKIEGDHSTRFVAHRSRLEIIGEERESIEAYLQALRDADELRPGEMVIRGRVVDSEGLPVAGAMVDLRGPYVYINHFETREDGTFAMPITPNETWGYYLRIRPREAEPRDTARFSLSYDDPERVVMVRLP